MKSDRRTPKKFLNQFIFEEIDHRLSCGWHAEIDNSVGRPKKYINEIKHTSLNKTSKNPVR